MPHSWKDIKLGRNQGLPEMPHSNMKGIKLPGMRVTEQPENNCKCLLEYGVLPHFSNDGVQGFP
jgi:hypothetical protein